MEEAVLLLRQRERSEARKAKGIEHGVSGWNDGRMWEVRRKDGIVE